MLRYHSTVHLPAGFEWKDRCHSLPARLWRGRNWDTHAAGECAHGYSLFGKHFGNIFRRHTPYDLAVPPLRTYDRKCTDVPPQISYLNVHSSFIHNNPKPETTQKSQQENGYTPVVDSQNGKVALKMSKSQQPRGQSHQDNIEWENADPQKGTKQAALTAVWEDLTMGDSDWEGPKETFWCWFYGGITCENPVCCVYLCSHGILNSRTYFKKETVII